MENESLLSNILDVLDASPRAAGAVQHLIVMRLVRRKPEVVACVVDRTVTTATHTVTVKGKQCGLDLALDLAYDQWAIFGHPAWITTTA